MTTEIKHGDVWIHESGYARGVLMVCDHNPNGDEPLVTGVTWKPGLPYFSMPESTFRARHHLVARDCDDGI